MRGWAWVALGLVLFSSNSVRAENGARTKVNHAQIQDWYQSGELKLIADDLLALLKSKQTLSKSDSIFAYKYAGVALAADSSKNQLAKDCMYKLLTLAPEIDIIDLYVSEGIYVMFNEVRQEYRRRNQYVKKKSEIENGAMKETRQVGVDTTLPLPARPSPLTENKKKSGHAWIYWTLGGAAVAGTVASFYILSQESGSKVESLSN